MRYARTIIALTLMLCFASPASAVAHSAEESKAIIVRVASHSPYSYSRSEVRAALRLSFEESSWRDTAKNGLCKGLFQVECGYADGKWHRQWLYRLGRWKDPRLNTQSGMAYIKSRYGKPSKALAHKHRFGWY